MEILQAEIVGYSSPKEIFVNGAPDDSAWFSIAHQCKFIDTIAKRETARWTGLLRSSGCGKAEGACAKIGNHKSVNGLALPPLRRLNELLEFDASGQSIGTAWLASE